ncbi:cytochrome c oxidase assembly protein [Arenibaculum pallidiluteum]|uniref:cytochrome c oxidase assembly protein n=1 Tax=Arenibaculum pallidiluteum TaxID=2812559 RepID=UPI001A9693FB|nr:cytochrome c oxidase assembly protein [Arenibaculum pallidiluteum]
MTPETRRRNRRVMLACTGLVAGMVGLSFASVPLYNLFCKVTGYGGTTQVAETAPAEMLDRVIKVRFNAEVNAGLPWRFTPEAPEVALKVGETGIVSYRAVNRADTPMVGTATFNVTPQKAGIYFNKIQCFCFTEQRLEPGQAVDMPVVFFVDPAIAQDPNLDDIETITLSYTFFRAKDDPGLKQVSEKTQ